MRILFLAILLIPLAAQADEPRTHDGFFLRLAVGGAGLKMEREGQVTSGSTNYYTGKSSIAGGAGATELSIGGTLGRHWVLAATLINHEIADPKLKRENESDLSLNGPLHFLMLGGSVEYFPDAKGGFHFGGTIGFAGAWVKSPDPIFTEYIGGAGGAISLSGGYAWWLSERWSLGVHVRITGAKVHGEDRAFGVTGSEDDSVAAFALSAEALYH